MVNAGIVLGYTLGSVVIVYMLLCIIVGLLSAGKVTNLKEFALGYKNISTGMLVATIYATHIGAGATLGLIEQINNVGIIAAVVALLSAISWHISKLIFCNNVQRFADCLSQADIMEKLYGPLGFLISKIVNVIGGIGVVAIQIAVIGLVMQYFLGLSQTMGIVLGAIVVTLYSASGGIKAVILTDLVQAMLFGIVLITTLFISVNKMVDQPDFWQLIPASKAWIVPHDMHSVLLVMGMITYALMPASFEAPFIQRILVSGSDKQLHKAFTYTAFIHLVVVITIGSIAIMLLPETGTGTLDKSGIFTIVSQNMHPMIITAVVIGVMAVTMSTADSWLNTSAVITTNFIARKNANLSGALQVKIARLVTIILGAVAAYVAFIGDSILSLLLLVICFEAPLMLVPMAAGFLGYKFTESDYKRSVITAIAAVLIGAYIEGEFGFISLLFGLIGSTVGLTWRKQWSFLRPDGTLMVQLPEYREASPKFLGLVLALGGALSLIHSYLTQAWLAGEISIIASFMAATTALLLHMYGYRKSKRYVFSTQIASMFLISSISSIAFRTMNPLMLVATFTVIGTMLLYRQHWPTASGLALSIISYNMLRMVVYTPPMPLLGVLIGIGTIMLATLAVLYQSARECYQETCEQLQSKDSLLEGIGHKLVGTLQELANTGIQLDSAYGRLTEYEDKLAATESQLASAEINLGIVDRQLTYAEGKLASTTNELASAKTELYFTKHDLKTALEDRVHIAKELERNNSFVVRVTEELTCKKEELKDVRKQLGKTRNELLATKLELEAKCRKYDPLAKEHREAKKALILVMEKLKGVNAQLKVTAKALVKSENKVVRTKALLEKTRKKLRVERKHATIDPLTQVYNRRYMNKKLKLLIQDAKERGNQFSIAVLDLDLFKALNDDYGEHHIGDSCLKQLVVRMKESIRKLDLRCRMGGDEFVIIMPDIGIEQAVAVAERVREAVATTAFKIDAEPGFRRCTISMGVASYTPGDTIKSLVSRADKALYAAKGKNVSKKKSKSKYRNRVFMCASGEQPKLIEKLQPNEVQVLLPDLGPDMELAISETIG